MPLCSRPFQSESDLAAMIRLLVLGRQAANGTYYIHQGDLNWWFSYCTPDTNPRQYTILFEDPSYDHNLVGWALFSPAWHALDVFVHPELRGTEEAAAIWIQAEETCLTQHIQAGRKTLSTLWIAETDAWSVAHLLGRGFIRTEDFMFVMERSLAEPVDEPVLPAGYGMRSPLDENEAALRAMPQHAAFESSMPPDQYIHRYARFMRSSGYPTCIDVMITAPDGRGAAFTITWPDPVNKIGLFEPVGVHPDFQRRGLGRAIVLDGFRRLQARGMRSAMVYGLSSLPEACAFYESLGFQPVSKLWTYEKELGR